MFTNSDKIMLPFPYKSPDGYGNGEEWYYNPNNDIADLGYGGGIKFNIKLNNYFIFNFGIIGEQLGYKTKLIDTVYVVKYPFSGILEHEKDINTYKYKFTYNLLSVPIGFKYLLRLNKNFNFSASGGIGPYLVISEKIEQYNVLTNSSNNESKKNSFRFNEEGEHNNHNIKENFIGNIDLGFLYNFKSKMLIELSPNYRMTLLNFKEHFDNSVKLFSFGMKLSVSY